MTVGDLQRLLALSALWGASFIFFRVIVPVLGPILTVELRVLIAGIALWLYARAAKVDLEWRTRGWWYVVVGVLNSALPFSLIAFAEVRLSASLASILNAATPLFAALFATAFFRDPLTGRKSLGLLLGFVGVIVLVGWSPLEDDLMTWLSVAAMIAATICYGLATNLTRAKLVGAPPLGVAVCSQLASSLVLLPLVPFNPPLAAPSLVVIACVLGISLGCTALAYVLYYRLILDLGATKASTVTFIMPVFGVLWGALFLGESVTVEKVVACAVILFGASLVTGLQLFKPREAVRPA